jgi:plastocyanin
MAMERKWTLLVVAAIAIAVVLVLALMFMGGDDGNDGNDPGPNEVWIDNMAFEPFNLTASVGATVTWTNNDAASHTVTSDDVGLFDSGTMTTGETFQFTFTEVGQYFYHCALHPEMHGVVTVVA